MLSTLLPSCFVRCFVECAGGGLEFSYRSIGQRPGLNHRLYATLGAVYRLFYSRDYFVCSEQYVEHRYYWFNNRALTTLPIAHSVAGLHLYKQDCHSVADGNIFHPLHAIIGAFGTILIILGWLLRYKQIA
jgi:hypothetical protein